MSQSQPINQAFNNKPVKSLHSRIQFLGILGWIIALIMIIAFVLQSIIFNFKPKPILTADPTTGVINGRVLFEDVFIRDDATIKKDIKAWVTARLSLNSSTIYENAQIALNHMCAELQNSTYESWLKVAYLAQIEASGGVAKIEFNEDELIINSDKKNGVFNAIVDGNYVIGLQNPKKTPFKIEISGNFLPKTESHTLGLEVCNYADV